MTGNRITSLFAICNCQHTRLLTIDTTFCGSFFLALLLLTMLGGCLPPLGTDKEFTSPVAALGRDSNHTARINCFLTLKDNQGPATRLEVISIEIQADDHWMPLTSRSLQVDSEEIGTKQLLVGSVAVPPGRYHRLRFRISKGEIKKTGGKYEVIASEPFSVEMNLTSNLYLEPENSRSLLITWDVQNSLQPDNTLAPVLTAAPPLKQLLRRLKNFDLCAWFLSWRKTM